MILSRWDKEEGRRRSVPHSRIFSLSCRMARQARHGNCGVRRAALASPTGLQSSSPRLRGTSYLGSTSKNLINPEWVASIPNISFVELDFVAIEKFTQLILKRNFAVMFLLARNVISHRLHLDRKSTRL